MDVALIPVWITSVAAAGSAVYAIVRNGRRSRRQEEALKSELKDELHQIEAKLGHPDTGLDAIGRAINGMALNCAKTTSSFKTEVNRNKEEIALLREKNIREDDRRGEAGTRSRKE